MAWPSTPAGKARPPTGAKACAGQSQAAPSGARSRKKPQSASSASRRLPASGAEAPRRWSAPSASANGGLASQGSGVPIWGVPTVMRPRTSGAMPARCRAARAASPLAECATTTMRWPGCACAMRCTRRATCSAWLLTPTVASSGTARAPGARPGASFHTASSAAVRRAVPARGAVLTASGAVPAMRKLNVAVLPPSALCTGAHAALLEKGAPSSSTGAVPAASHASTWRRISATTSASASACTWLAASGAAGALQPLAAGGTWLAESTRPSLPLRKSSSAASPVPSDAGSTPERASAMPASRRASTPRAGASCASGSAPRSRRAGASVAMATASASPSGGPSGSSHTRPCTPRALAARRPMAYGCSKVPAPSSVKGRSSRRGNESGASPLASGASVLSSARSCGKSPRPLRACSKSSSSPSRVRVGAKPCSARPSQRSSGRA